MPSSRIKTILIVEDEMIIAMMESESLKQYGYAVLTVCTGEEAIALVNSETQIDLILMDIDLGKGINGPDTARTILKNFDIPIVFLSGHTEPEMVALTERITCYGYVVKHSAITVLDASIKMAFKLFEAKELALESNHQLEATLDALPDLMLEVDLHGKCYDYHSPRTELLFSSSMEILGHTLAELLPLEAANVMTAAIHEAYERDFSIGKQFSIPNSEGTLWFELSVASKTTLPTKPRFIILCRDISNRMRTEENLRIHQVELQMQIDEFAAKQSELDSERAKYYALFDLAPISLLSLDAKGMILEANARIATLLQMRRCDLIGEAFTRIICATDQDIFYLFRKNWFASHSPKSCELSLRCLDGTQIPVKIAASVIIDHNDAQIHLVITTYGQGQDAPSTKTGTF